MVTAFIKRHPVLCYYALTFVISWGAILIVVGPAGLIGTGDTIVVSGMVSLVGPSLAGVLLTGVVDGRDGYRRLLSRLGSWRVGRRWYGIALLTAPVVMGASAVALSMADPAFRPAFAVEEDKVGLLLMAVGAGVFVPFFEELGWTGFAMPRLLERHRIPRTGVLMGVLWGVWHLPFFAGSTDPSGVVPGWLLVAILLLAWLPAYRVLMVWVYGRTGSLLLGMLMHLPIVAGMYMFADDSFGLGLAVKVLVWGAAFGAIAVVGVRTGTRVLSPTRATNAPRGLPA